MKKSASRQAATNKKRVASSKAASAAKSTAKRAAAKTGSAAKQGKSGDAAKRIDGLIEGLHDWRGAVLAKLRKVVHKAVPDVVEEWKWLGTPVWSRDGMFVLANAHKEKVKITFLHGAHLVDPKKLFNNGLEGNKWRAIDVREHDDLNARALEALVIEAVAYNASHKVPKSRGSRAEPARSPGAGRRRQATPRRPSAAPVLLSGGNPQIAKADGDAPVQAYIAAMPGWKRGVEQRLDALIENAVPDVRKAVKWNSPFWGVEGQGWFASAHCFTRYVKLTFFRGAALRPPPPGASKQRDVRMLDIHEGDALDETQLTAWFRQAAALPGWTP